MTLPDWKQKQLTAHTVTGKPVCIIPARKTSVRLPGKNKAILGGKPLVQHAIEVAKESQLFSMIVVSSDDMDILEIAYECGVFPHNRPEVIRGKGVQQKEICIYVLGLSQVPKTDIFCLLPVTNPFKYASDLIAGYDLIWEKQANYAGSMVRCSLPSDYALIEKKGWMVPRRGFQAIKQSQKYDPEWRYDGAFIFARREVFEIEFEYGFYGSKVARYELPRRGVDIDTQDDLDYARYLWLKDHPILSTDGTGAVASLIIPGVNSETI